MKNKEILSIKKSQKTRSIVGGTLIILSVFLIILPLVLMLDNSAVAIKIVLAISGFILMILGVLMITTGPVINRCSRCGENYGYYFCHDHRYDNNEDHPEDECLRNLSRKLKSL